MKKISFKKFFCIMLAVIILVLSVPCAIAEVAPDETGEIGEQAETAEPTATPVPNTKKLPQLSCKEGVYEELDLTDNWERGEAFTKLFYVQNYTGVENDDGRYFLKIDKFESAYTIYLNGIELAANMTQQDVSAFVRQGDNELRIEAEKISGNVKMLFMPAVVVGGITVENGEKQGTVNVSVNVKNISSEAVSGTLEVTVYELGKFEGGVRTTHAGVGSVDTTFDAAAGTIGLASPATVTLRDFDDNKKWSFANPFMFEVAVRLNKNTFTQRFRICDVRSDDVTGFVMVNDNPVFVNALLIDKDTVDFVGDVATYLTEIKASNVNTIIGEGVVFNDEWKDRAEEIGLFVFGDGELPFEMTDADEIAAKSFDVPTLAVLADDATEDYCAAVRASRKYCGIALKDVELCRKWFSDVGIAVELLKTEAGREDNITVDVSVINDMNVDLKNATATLEIKNGGVVLATEKKEYESLKKLGTAGRDVMTREFSFTIPATIKDGGKIEMKITVDYDGSRVVRTKEIVVDGGNEYEAPYSQLAVIVVLVAVTLIIGAAAIISLPGGRKRTEKKK